MKPRRLFLLYALAKAYDEAGDVQRAFACAAAGSQLRRARWSGDEPAERARLAAAAPGEPLAPGPCREERLVFVFGLPRSGTTLVEQILAGHGDVFALGETEIFAQQAERGLDPAALATAYLAALPEAASGAARVVDKSLGSVLHIGAIRAAFPGARFVHVRRDPLDVGLSCHFTLFQHDLPFPPDLAGLWPLRARPCQADGRLERGAAAGGLGAESTTKNLVAEPERTARGLLDFVGLDWRPQCLDAGGAPREIRTASLAQAREAPHGRSVGRWRRYEAFLGPLRRELEEAT